MKSNHSTFYCELKLRFRLSKLEEIVYWCCFHQWALMSSYTKEDILDITTRSIRSGKSKKRSSSNEDTIDPIVDITCVHFGSWPSDCVIPEFASVKNFRTRSYPDESISSFSTISSQCIRALRLITDSDESITINPNIEVEEEESND